MTAHDSGRVFAKGLTLLPDHHLMALASSTDAELERALMREGLRRIAKDPLDQYRPPLAGAVAMFVRDVLASALRLPILTVRRYVQQEVADRVVSRSSARRPS